MNPYSEHPETDWPATLAAAATTLTTYAPKVIHSLRAMDDLGDSGDHLRAHLIWLTDHIDAITATIDHALAGNPPPIPCANATCPEHALADKAGRCSACYQYQRRTGRDRQP